MEFKPSKGYTLLNHHDHSPSKLIMKVLNEFDWDPSLFTTKFDSTHWDSSANRKIFWNDFLKSYSLDSANFSDILKLKGGASLLHKYKSDSEIQSEHPYCELKKKISM